MMNGEQHGRGAERFGSGRPITDGKTRLWLRQRLLARLESRVDHARFKIFCRPCSHLCCPPAPPSTDSSAWRASHSSSSSSSSSSSTMPPPPLVLLADQSDSSAHSTIAGGGVLRGTIVNRTYGIHKKYIYLSIFTNKIWSYYLWSPVIVNRTIYF